MVGKMQRENCIWEKLIHELLVLPITDKGVFITFQSYQLFIVVLTIWVLGLMMIKLV